jgi:hypothetical protein
VVVVAPWAAVVVVVAWLAVVVVVVGWAAVVVVVAACVVLPAAAAGLAAAAAGFAATAAGLAGAGAGFLTCPAALPIPAASSSVNVVEVRRKAKVRTMFMGVLLLTRCGRLNQCVEVGTKSTVRR